MAIKVNPAIERMLNLFKIAPPMIDGGLNYSFTQLANMIAMRAPRGANETTIALRKLFEARDAANLAAYLHDREEPK